MVQYGLRQYQMLIVIMMSAQPVKRLMHEMGRKQVGENKTLKERLKEKVREIQEDGTLQSSDVYSIDETIDEVVDGLVAELQKLKSEYDSNAFNSEKLETIYYEGRRDGLIEVLLLLGVEVNKQ